MQENLAQMLFSLPAGDLLANSLSNTKHDQIFVCLNKKAVVVKKEMYCRMK